MKTNNLPYIIAIDFDGTLVKDAFPAIGEPNKLMFEMVNIWRQSGARVILWTCRNNTALMEALRFCRDQGVEFDAVNQNIEEVEKMFGGDTRKVYADIYIDDKAVHVDNVPLVGVVKDIAVRNISYQPNTKVDKQPTKRNSGKSNGKRVPIRETRH